MARLARGDEQALEELLQNHWDALVDYATRLLDSPDDAQDVAQDAFVRLWDRRSDWHAGSVARPILFRVARNLCLDRQRGARVRARWDASRPSPDGELPPDGAFSLEEQELQAAIDLALQALGQREREIVVLSRLHGLSRREVAEVTGLAPQTVSNLLSTAVARLWRALAPYLDDQSSVPVRRRSLRKI